MAQSPGKTTPAAKAAAATPSTAATKSGKTAKGKTAAGAKSPVKSSAPAPAKSPAKTASSSRSKAAAHETARKTPARAARGKGNGEAVPAQTPAPQAAKLGVVTPEQRYRMICDAAYFRAERRGFVGGSALQDWLEAEAEIDALLREMQE